MECNKGFEHCSCEKNWERKGLRLGWHGVPFCFCDMKNKTMHSRRAEQFDTNVLKKMFFCDSNQSVHQKKKNSRSPTITHVHGPLSSPHPCLRFQTENHGENSIKFHQKKESKNKIKSSHSPPLTYIHSHHP